MITTHAGGLLTILTDDGMRIPNELRVISTSFWRFRDIFSSLDEASCTKIYQLTRGGEIFFTTANWQRIEVRGFLFCLLPVPFVLICSCTK